MTYIVQLFTGAAGSVAFGILFHMKKKHLPLAALGGFLGWYLSSAENAGVVCFFQHWQQLLESTYMRRYLHVVAGVLRRHFL